MRRNLSILVTAAVVSLASAQSFNIDIDRFGQPGAGTPGLLAGAAGQPGYWNLISPGANSNAGLSPIGGGSTNVSLQKNGGSGGSTNIPGATIEYNRLFADYDAVYFPQSSIDYTFLGLAPGVYRLCVYAYLPGQSGWYLDQFNLKTYYLNYLGVYVNNVSVGSAVTYGEAPVNSFVKGVTHANFCFTVGAGAPPVKIVASTGSSANERCALNGFQLMKYTASRLYVNDDAAGLNNGTSWNDAFTDLHDALQLAANSAGQITEIWVAAGTYKPHATARAVSFVIPSGVRIYGGFSGNESSLAQRPANPNANPSVLSGEIGAPANLSDNSYHLLNVNNTSILTRLDGFTLRWATANGSGSNNNGAIAIASNAQIEFRNCLFRDCYAAGEGAFFHLSNNAQLKFVKCDFFDGYAVSFGGAIRNAGSGSGFQAVNCRFISNYSQNNGGAINSTSGLIELYNCVFSSNFGGGYGGAVLIWGSGVTANITNCSFWNNGAGTHGGIATMYGAHADIENTALHSNPDTNAATNLQDANIGGTNGTFAIDYSLVQGWNGTHSGVGVMNSWHGWIDPNGLDDVAGTLDDDFRPASDSYLIDRGSNIDLPSDACDVDADNNKIEPLPIDLGGNPRRLDHPGLADYGQGTAPIVDIGAYEYLYVAPDCDPCDINCNGTVNQFDIPVFVSMLSGGGSPCSPCAGDVNGNGTTNAFDISAFLDCLSH